MKNTKLRIPNLACGFVSGIFFLLAGNHHAATPSEYVPGTMFTGAGERIADKDKAFGNIRAIDALTGSWKWDFRLRSPPWCGVLSTAGGLVFSGSNEGNFFALDAHTGKPLWDFQTGGPVRANPISLATDGYQRIAITAARSIIVFGLD